MASFQETYMITIKERRLHSSPQTHVRYRLSAVVREVSTPGQTCATHSVTMGDAIPILLMCKPQLRAQGHTGAWMRVKVAVEAP